MLRENFSGMEIYHILLGLIIESQFGSYSLHLYCILHYKKETLTSEMFKVKNGAHPHLKTIPFGVAQVNTLLGIPFDKF